MDFHAYQLGHWREWKLWRMWNYSHSSAVHMDNCSFKCVWSFIVLLARFFYLSVSFNLEEYRLLMPQKCILVGKYYPLNSPTSTSVIFAYCPWVINVNPELLAGQTDIFLLLNQIWVWEGSIRAVLFRNWYMIVCWRIFKNIYTCLDYRAE